MRFEHDPEGGAPIVVATDAELDAFRGLLASVLSSHHVEARSIPDIVQNVMLIAWIALRDRRIRGAPGRKPEDVLRGFLVVTARHLAANHVRKWSVKYEIPASAVDSPLELLGPDPSGQVEAREALRILTRLRPVAAAALVRSAYGLTLREVEAKTGIHRSVAHWHLKKARRALLREIHRRPLGPIPPRPRDRKKSR